GNLSLVKQLLESNEDVNAPVCSAYGQTALQAAASRGHLEIVQLLLSAGANVDAPGSSNTGRTAIQAAAATGFREVVRVLRRAIRGATRSGVLHS
ncbi:ankyrin repeat protein, partial [Mycena sanguinolenta]